ncbi:MAG: CpsB/CapC family capsule biosynthesis tyrosine phosphatase [Desulfobacterales bacterium]
MIDTHCHILAGFDDGAFNTDMSVHMAQLAASDGIQTIVATPHIRDCSLKPEVIEEAVHALNACLKQLNIPVTILPGAEVSLSLDPLCMTDYTINNTPYILIEIPPTQFQDHFKESLFQLKIKGYRPVIAHPERHPNIIKQPELLVDLHDSDIGVQITADSLTGRFGRDIQRCAEHLLYKNAVDMIASDAHSSADRLPGLSRGLKIAAGIIGMEKAMSLVTTNPEAIVHGEYFPRVTHA